MISRRAMRRSLSLVLSLVIVLWAESGLAMPAASSHGWKCHVGMVQMNGHTAHTVTPEKGPHSMPCCPSHPAPALSQSAEHTGCCDISSQPARPLAFLVSSGNSFSLQWNATGPAGTILVQAQSRSAFLAGEESPRFVRPVFELKTDLRI
jgi:hypothetical protein